MLDRSKPPRVSQVEIVMIEGSWWWRYPAGIAPKTDQPAKREDELRGMRKRKEVDARVQRRRRGGKTDMTASGGWWSGGHVVHEEFDDDQGDAELTVDEIGGELEGAESARPRQPREVTLMEMVRPSKVKISKRHTFTRSRTPNSPMNGSVCPSLCAEYRMTVKEDFHSTLLDASMGHIRSWLSTIATIDQHTCY